MYVVVVDNENVAVNKISVNDFANSRVSRT